MPLGEALKLLSRGTTWVKIRAQSSQKARIAPSARAGIVTVTLLRPYWCAAAHRAYPVLPETAPSRRFLVFDDLNDLQNCISLQIREALNEPRLMILKAERNS